MEKKNNQIQYATTSNLSMSCPFLKDYSYYTNWKCLDCKFCYSKLDYKPVVKKRYSKFIFDEYRVNPNIFKVPVTISSYCEPFVTDSVTTQSLDIINAFLDHDGQAIIKTAKSNLREDVFERLNKDTMFQGRVFTSTDSTSNGIRQALAPGYSNTSDMLELLSKLSKKGVETALLFDPLVIGLNDYYLFDLLDKVQDFGVNKVIIKQLFSTEFFKSYLSLYIGKRYSNALDQETCGYFTYDNILLLSKLYKVFEKAEKKNIYISMCYNKYINKLVNKMDNCCLFEGAKYMYPELSWVKHTSSPEIIKRKD